MLFNKTDYFFSHNAWCHSTRTFQAKSRDMSDQDFHNFKLLSMDQVATEEQIEVHLN